MGQNSEKATFSSDNFFPGDIAKSEGHSQWAKCERDIGAKGNV